MSNYNDSLGDRMKRYEDVPRTRLAPKLPVAMRLDGKAFHTFTRGFKKPFDNTLHQAMRNTAQYLCKNIQGAQLAYIQSDEISITLSDRQSLKAQGWFDYEIQKMCSIAASMASVCFFDQIRDFVYEFGVALPAFDCRVWNIPHDEVTNYFIWRQQDATRNSIQSLGQSHFSHAELHGKSCGEIQNMLLTQRDVNWNSCPIQQKRGVCVVKATEHSEFSGVLTARTRWVIDAEIPIFTENRDYIESRLLC